MVVCNYLTVAPIYEKSTWDECQIWFYENLRTSFNKTFLWILIFFNCKLLTHRFSCHLWMWSFHPNCRKVSKTCSKTMFPKFLILGVTISLEKPPAIFKMWRCALKQISSIFLCRLFLPVLIVLRLLHLSCLQQCFTRDD